LFFLGAPGAVKSTIIFIFYPPLTPPPPPPLSLRTIFMPPKTSLRISKNLCVLSLLNFPRFLIHCPTAPTYCHLQAIQRGLFPVFSLSPQIDALKQFAPWLNHHAGSLAQLRYQVNDAMRCVFSVQACKFSITLNTGFARWIVASLHRSYFYIQQRIKLQG
jgi:hypothetical protein